jgi:hypothetical protein
MPNIIVHQWEMLSPGCSRVVRAASASAAGPGTLATPGQSESARPDAEARGHRPRQASRAPSGDARGCGQGGSDRAVSSFGPAGLRPTNSGFKHNGGASGSLDGACESLRGCCKRIGGRNVDVELALREK